MLGDLADAAVADGVLHTLVAQLADGRHDSRRTRAPRLLQRAVGHSRRDGADFIKIMISGLMDFDRFGVLSEPGMDPAELRELIGIAHGEGFSVMTHANGARTVQAAAEAGVTLL